MLPQENKGRSRRTHDEYVSSSKKDLCEYQGIKLINHTGHRVSLKKLQSIYPHVIFLLESEDTKLKERNYERNLAALPDYSTVELNFNQEEKRKRRKKVEK